MRDPRRDQSRDFDMKAEMIITRATIEGRHCVRHTRACVYMCVRAGLPSRFTSALIVLGSNSACDGHELNRKPTNQPTRPRLTIKATGKMQKLFRVI